MYNISVQFSPEIENEERQIIENVFKQNVEFSQYIKKGIAGGAFDIQIIIDFLNSPGLNALLKTGEVIGLIGLIINKIFKRNRAKIMDDKSRPRYTNLTLRMETKLITISNVNIENKVTITKASANSGEVVKNEDEYSADKLAEYINE